MKKLIIANWKMYVTRLEDADALFEIARLDSARETQQAPRTTHDLVLCPPFPYLFEAKRLGVPVTLGAQDVSADIKGAHTSEVSPLLLKDAGIEYVIIGHSERRANGETDELINKKMHGALQAGLHPILCVGEPAHIRRAGMEATRNFIYTQLKKALRDIPNSKLPTCATSSAQSSERSKKASADEQIPNSIVVAYEPLWAISVNGKGASDKPEDSVEIITFIKEILAAKPYTLYSKVLYGGSIRAENLRTFIDRPEIDGALIGKASTEPKEFEAILARVSEMLKEKSL